MFDREVLRNNHLIEERMDYENSFISMEDIMKSEELDYYINLQFDESVNRISEDLSSLYEEHVGSLDLAFDFEDCLIQSRDEDLIGEYFNNGWHNIDIDVDEFALNDIFDFQIKDLEEMEFIERNGYDYDFKYEPEDYGDYEYDQYEEEMFWTLHYLRESQFATQNTCECGYMDYMPNDDGLCDYLDCYDYPEGPNENLCGIKFY